MAFVAIAAVAGRLGVAVSARSPLAVAISAAIGGTVGPRGMAFAFLGSVLRTVRDFARRTFVVRTCVVRRRIVGACPVGTVVGDALFGEGFVRFVFRRTRTAFVASLVSAAATRKVLVTTTIVGSGR